jgi:CheY-like chemotaxis protein
MRIVIVDPDSEFRQGLVTQLRRRQFDTVGAADAASLYRDLAAHPCDVVILDPDLPGENGFSVASYLRNTSHVGIVMVSLEASLERRLECLASVATSSRKSFTCSHRACEWCGGRLDFAGEQLAACFTHRGMHCAHVVRMFPTVAAHAKKRCGRFEAGDRRGVWTRLPSLR